MARDNVVNKHDKRRLLENFISLSSIQVVSILLSLATLPYVLRIIGYEKYGVIVFATSLVAYFQSITDYSFRITATRDVAVFRHSLMKLNIIYTKVLIIKGVFLFLSLFLIGISVALYEPFSIYKDIYFYCSLTLIGYAIFPEWFFQGIEKMKYITFLNVSIKVFFTATVFVFIKTPEDFWIYPLSQSLGFIFAGLIGQIIVIRQYGLRFVPVKMSSLLRTIKSNFPIFINQFVPTLYNNTSTFLLGLMTSSVAVGTYQAIQTIVNLGVSLIEIISRVFFPFLNRKRKAFSVFAKIMFSLVTLMIITIVVMKPVVFWYLNLDDTRSNYLVLVILASGLAGYALYNIFGLNYFIINRQDKVVMRNTLYSSVFGLLLAFPLVNTLGILGAAINLSLSRFFMGGGLLVKYFIRDKKNGKSLRYRLKE